MQTNATRSPACKHGLCAVQTRSMQALSTHSAFAWIAWMQAADFYEYYEGLQEGWDGPALLVFSDGKQVGARLDRNGLRPARFWRTKDDLIYVASEVRLAVGFETAGVGLATDTGLHGELLRAPQVGQAVGVQTACWGRAGLATDAGACMVS